ncbi:MULTISPECIES: ribosome maturation factor RimP [Bartonella]|nr:MULTISPECIES: ribosome maturation factor RimP [Bartonella]AQX17883.1 ribosome maturation factor RimP [Bartonella sp. A1379B]AQX22395.1 ribosome maturation factor RimP [Bartonella sp. 11B]AQX24322.1 ribosome maturation factor RimP [Bartonella sp. 114]AQX24843.1 ribosome maturation factor RimP [Bartonella sp. Coyote22sub2]KEC57424.1 ribosome maturation factor rimP [Bartonella rochalimae ATCC BAA-1498]
MNEIERMGDIDEPRLFEEDGVAARVSALIIPLLKPLGFRLVRTKLLGLNGLTLQIMVERTNGTMTIEDCEIVSRAVAPLLDIENVIERKYHLEISSPGIDRLLVRKSDFVHWQGHLAKIETNTVIDGRQKLRGKLKDITQNGFTLNIEKTAHREEINIFISFSNITNAHLILTDELIRDTLKKNKDLDKQLISNDNLKPLKNENKYNT